MFDTLALCMAGGDENSSQDMGRAIQSLKLIQRETGAHVQVVHHTGKDGGAERGSSALRGAADTMMAVRSTGGGRFTLECDKQKDGERFETSEWRLSIEGGSCVPVIVETWGSQRAADPIKSKLTNNHKTLLGELQGQPWGLTISEAHNRTGLSKSRVSEGFAKLRDLGLATFDPDGGKNGGGVWMATSQTSVEGSGVPSVPVCGVSKTPHRNGTRNDPPEYPTGTDRNDTGTERDRHASSEGFSGSAAEVVPVANEINRNGAERAGRSGQNMSKRNGQGIGEV
jgi:hypothetical protein